MRGKPIGRPPKAPEFKRSTPLKIMLTEGEREDIDRAAGGNEVSGWAREILLRAAKRGSGEKGNRTQPGKAGP
jgi:hypothetical protein